MYKILLTMLLGIPLAGFTQIGFISLDSKKVPEPVTRDTAVVRWNQSQPGYRTLLPQAREMLYWTNYARLHPTQFWQEAVVPILAAFETLNKQEAVSLKTDLSKAESLPMFALNTTLIGTAQRHAEDIGSHHAPLSHQSTDGRDFGARMKTAQIKFCANENISLSSQSILLSIVLLYLDIGVPGMGHRNTLLNPILREIGIGAALYDKGQYFLVQDFACKQTP